MAFGARQGCRWTGGRDAPGTGLFAPCADLTACGAQRDRIEALVMVPRDDDLLLDQKARLCAQLPK
jgi:hypothetical protein